LGLLWPAWPYCFFLPPWFCWHCISKNLARPKASNWQSI